MILSTSALEGPGPGNTNESASWWCFINFHHIIFHYFVNSHAYDLIQTISYFPIWVLLNPTGAGEQDSKKRGNIPMGTFTVENYYFCTLGIILCFLTSICHVIASSKFRPTALGSGEVGCKGGQK